MRAAVCLCLVLAPLSPLWAQQSALDTHLAAARKARDQKLYADAEREGSAALQEAEKLGLLSPRLNAALADLGYTFYIQRKYTDAEPLYFRATEIADPAGIDPRTQSVQLNYLGMARFHGNKQEAALAPLEHALALREKAIGPDHPNVAQLLVDLATVQAALTKRDLAEASLRRALRIQDQFIGPDRAQTAATMMQLGSVLDAEVKHEEAETFYRGALKIREAVLGPESAPVADTLDDLAELLRTRGNNKDAEPLQKRALAIRTKVFGAAGPRVARSFNNLALIERNLGHPDEAEKLLLQAVDIAENKDSLDQGSLARYLSNLASLYRSQGQLREAEKVAVRAVALREAAFGASDPLIRFELETLAGVYSDQLRFSEAEPLSRRALSILEKDLGPDHPQVANACNALANNLVSQARFPEADPLFRRAVEIGLKHPQDDSAISAIGDAARGYQAAYQYEQAEALYQRALALRHAVNESPIGELREAQARNSFALLLREEGRYREAAEYLEQAVASGKPRRGERQYFYREPGRRLSAGGVLRQGRAHDHEIAGRRRRQLFGRLPGGAVPPHGPDRFRPAALPRSCPFIPTGAGGSRSECEHLFSRRSPSGSRQC